MSSGSQTFIAVLSLVIVSFIAASSSSICILICAFIFFSSPALLLPFYYRAMHFSAKRGIAIACRLSVPLSVCDGGEL